MRSSTETDVLIVGAGPAGLAAAAGLRGTGLRMLVVEQGSSLVERDAHRSRHLASGVGGAGLFSDGKFSFRPSATRLWELAPTSDLRNAYLRLTEALAAVGVGAPAFDASLPGAGHGTQWVGNARRKRYPSLYVSPGKRSQLIGNLASVRDGCSLLTRTRAVMIRRDTHDCLSVTLQRSAPGGRPQVVRTRAVVLAGGRFGPLCDLVFDTPVFPSTFRRLELGVRVEQPADVFFLAKDPLLDPKLLIDHESGRYSWRTFCCCRNGEVVATEFDGMTTLSGRADCPPTGRSNVGFNLRITDEAEAVGLLHEMTARLRIPVADNASTPLTSQPLGALIADGGPSRDSLLHQQFGERVAGLLCEGLRRLRAIAGAGLDAARVTGPTLEGVGRYPLVTADLRVPGFPVWVAGDSGGLFRGVTAALVSGFFVSRRIERYFRRMACH